MDELKDLAAALLHTIRFLQKDAGCRDGFAEHITALKNILETDKEDDKS